MNNKSKILAVLLLAAFAASGIQPAYAADYAFRVSAAGVRSPDVIPTFSTFSVSTRAIGSGSFQLTPPNSNSSGAFTFTSSNPAVATIAGNTVTLVGIGSTTITATQAPSEGYQGGSVAANFVVSAPTGYLSSGGLLWLIPLSSAVNIKGTEAADRCRYSQFLGQSGWRLPTQAEAKAMVNDVGYSQLINLGWTSWAAWTSTTMPRNMLVFQANGVDYYSEAGSNYNALTCVK